MPSFAETLKERLAHLCGHHEMLPSATTIPANQCFPAVEVGAEIVRNKDYFTLRVNEMSLRENAKWWVKYDPLVFCVVEFNYAGNRVALPVAIGPHTIKRQWASDQPKYGSVMNDTLVAGPYPYRGGDVDVSLSLYRIERDNRARTLLKMVEGLSSLFAGAGQFEMIAKVGGPLLEGIEALLGLNETALLAGQRACLTPSPFSPLRSGFAILLTTPGDTDLRNVRVRERRLMYFDENEAKELSYRASDFVLWNVIGSSRRADENTFPFYRLKVEALRAVAEGKSGVKRGKANLITAYQQMLEAPDMTTVEANELFSEWCGEFEARCKRFEDLKMLSPTQRTQSPSVRSFDFEAAIERLNL